MRMLLFLTALLFYNTLSAQQDDSQKYKVDSGYYSSFDHTKIYYEVRGKGQPVILIHGFIVTGESWKRTPLFHDLLRYGFKVITLDLRGNGKSDKPKNELAYASDAEVRDVKGLARHLHLGKY